MLLAVMFVFGLLVGSFLPLARSIGRRLDRIEALLQVALTDDLAALSANLKGLAAVVPKTKEDDHGQ